MTITIIIEELLKDIRERSHLDVQGMEPDMQYRTEAGSDKNEQLKREIVIVSSALTRMLQRYLNVDDTAQADNTLDGRVGQQLVWELDMSDRRASNKAQPLADACHDYLVHYTLARYYKSVNAGELSNTHSLQTADAAGEIEGLLFSKTPPRYEPADGE
ncbi:MAG: hypothetical protein IKW84_08960 [Bacteroidaceae bacterium]|nr:hypothetical protein [Bacteroidaceae bacterium]MBR5159692.1 hypothetical protein [Bacteroidaceae bacterium]